MKRRHFLGDMGLGFTGLALHDLLAAGGARAAARADSVIWLFMMGGVSHVEGFDPKPALNRHAGKRINELGASTLSEDRLTLQEVGPQLHHETKILPLQVGFGRRGAAGVEVSDWWPEVGGCVDDLAIVRSMYTTDTEHSAVFQFHTGRSQRDAPQPSLGAWVSYGLGSRNENLPRFVVMGTPPSSHQGGLGSHQALYLGPSHDGVAINPDPRAVLPFRADAVHPSPEAQRRELDFIRRLDQMAGVRYPDDQALKARIRAYEIGYGMQSALPDAVDLGKETPETQRLYGLDRPVTRPFGQQCLVARRLVEKGVRFVQLYHGGNPDNDSGDWDSHEKLREKHAAMTAQVDRPIAGLLKDLKRRGMLDRTLVAWVTEFGRTPNVDARTPCGPPDENVRTGRDHHIYGFSIWLAGAGIKKGVVHGATDELGFHAVEHRHYVTDVHATVLHLLGLEPQRLGYPGQQRLALDRGRVIREILA